MTDDVPIVPIGMIQCEGEPVEGQCLNGQYITVPSLRIQAMMEFQCSHNTSHRACVWIEGYPQDAVPSDFDVTLTESQNLSMVEVDGQRVRPKTARGVLNRARYEERKAQIEEEEGEGE